MDNINYTIHDKCIYLQSDAQDNPLIPHLDSEGNSIANWEPPFTIVEGVSAKLSGKTLMLSMSGKRGNFLKFKLPAKAIMVLADALSNLSSDDNPITKETYDDLQVALEDLNNE